MYKESKLVAESRTGGGSAEARRLRKKGRLPGVINDEKGGSRLVSMDKHGFELMLGRHSSANLILDVEIDGGNPVKVLLKEVQHHPVTDEALHVDFVEISMTKKMRVRIPIVLKGEPVGVTQEGGILEQPLRELEVECLPGDLVETITADVSGLKLNQSLLVEKLVVDPKLTVLTDLKLSVAGVMEPRKEDEVTAEGAAAEAAPTEPELIGREKKEGEEEEEGEGKAEEKKPAEDGKKKEEAKKPAEGAKKKEEGAKKAEEPKKKESKAGK